MLVDLHCHSDYSDGGSTYEEIAAAARARGLDGVALTDHDVQGDPERLRRAAEREGVVLFLAMEMTCAEGHFLVFGLDGARDKASALRSLGMDPSKEHPHAAQVVEAVGRIGGAVVAAHPFLSCYRSDGSFVDNTTVPGIVAAEVHNGSVEGMIEEQCWSRLHATRLKLGRTGGSDAHGAASVGSCVTILPWPVRDVGELIGALRSGRTEGAMLDASGSPVRWAAFDEAWAWRAGTGRWARLDAGAPPAQLGGAVSVFDTERSRMLFFGGSGVEFAPHGRVVSLDLERREWSLLEAEGEAPPPLCFAGACLRGGGEAVIAGGWRPGKGALSDAWALDLAANRWRRIPSDGLPPVRGARLCCLPDGAVAASGRYSRYSGAKSTDPVYLLASNGNAWRRVEGANVIRWGVGAAASGGKLHVWGGFNYFRISASHDEYDPASGEWSSRELPEGLARRDFACCETASGRAFVYGGHTHRAWPVPDDSGAVFALGGNELREEIAPGGPPPVAHGCAASNVRSGEVILVGGFTTAPIG